MVRFVTINEDQFLEWKEMRKELYVSLSDEHHEQEMEQVHKSDVWHCYFLVGDGDHVFGLVELSSRNIVDGCLSSPVAYLEGFYLKPEHRRKGLGRKIIDIIQNWCRERGSTELAADTELTNTAAQRFYRAAGFQETERVVEFRLEIDEA